MIRVRIVLEVAVSIGDDRSISEILTNLDTRNRLGRDLGLVSIHHRRGFDRFTKGRDIITREHLLCGFALLGLSHRDNPRVIARLRDLHTRSGLGLRTVKDDLHDSGERRISRDGGLLDWLSLKRTVHARLCFDSNGLAITIGLPGALTRTHGDLIDDALTNLRALGRFGHCVRQERGIHAHLSLTRDRHRPHMAPHVLRGFIFQDHK